jgi:hypothetical protein
MRTQIAVIGGEGRGARTFASSKTLVNCFLEAAAGRPVLYGGPGFASRVTLATSPVRGVYTFGDVLLVVSGNRLYTVTEGGTATDRGEVLGSEYVDISDNGIEAVIVARDAEKKYYWNGTTFGEITDADVGILSSVDFIDQYIVGSIKDSSQFQISALADVTDWNALDIATSETRPDKLLGVWVDNRDLLLLGERTIEGWYNSGAADFPLERSQLFFELGLMGRDCIAAVDNTVCFLAEDGTVRAIRGGTPVIISTPAIANIIARWNDPSTARAFSFTLRNHQFWALRHADGCVVWDASAPPGDDSWHVRKSYGAATWKIAFAQRAWGVTILGDATSGKLYTLDADTHTEAGAVMERYLVTDTLGPGEYFTLNSIEALIEPGVGLLSGQGSDPKVWLRLSRNGGHTFGARMERRIGERGDYEKRITWNGGFGPFRPQGGVLELGISDPVPFVLKGAWADFTADVS